MHRLHDRLGLRTNPIIFFLSAAILAMFVTATITFPEPVESFFAAGSDWILTSLGWFYIFGVTSFVAFLLWMALSHFGSVRLGDDDEQPRYSTPVWFAMLFAAGIGTILMFWGVAEPISHFANPPMRDVEPESTEAAREALTFTMYHFALHTWNKAQKQQQTSESHPRTRMRHLYLASTSKKRKRVNQFSWNSLARDSCLSTRS